MSTSGIILLPKTKESYTLPITVDEEHSLIFFRKEEEFSGDELEYMKAIDISVVSVTEAYVFLRLIEKRPLWLFMKSVFSSYMEHNVSETQEIIRKLKTLYDKLYSQTYEFSLKRFSQFKNFYDHQKECVFLGVHRKDNMFALDQGLGKTLIAIAISEIATSGVTLIVAPAACKWNWWEEMENWDIDMSRVTMLDSGGNIIGKEPKYVIINYDILESNLNYIKTFNITHIIADECHKVKNMDSNRSHLFREIFDEFNCKLTLLSGTPVPNRIDDVFVYLVLKRHVLSENKAAFMRRYTDTVPTRFGNKVVGGKDLSELNSYISNFMVRRTKEQYKEVLGLPDKKYHKLVFNSDEYAEEYEEAYREFARNFNATKSKAVFEAGLQQLSIITSKAKMKDIIRFAEGLIGKQVKVLGQTKVYDSKHLSVGTSSYNYVCGKVVIFSVFTNPLNVLQEYFRHRCVRIDGSVPNRRRIDIVNEFKSNNEVNVLIGNLTAAGIGLNMVNKEYEKDRPAITSVIHVNFPFTDSELEQGNDRVYRIGAYKDIDIYNTVLEGSIDEKLCDLIQKKQRDTSHVVDGEPKVFDYSDLSTDIIEELANEIENFKNSFN